MPGPAILASMQNPFRRLLLPAAALAMSHLASAQTSLLQDALEGSTTINDTKWLYSFSSSVAFGLNSHTTNSTTDKYLTVPAGQHVVAFWPSGPISVTSGSSIQVAFDLYLTSSPNAADTGSFRLGLFSSEGSAKPTGSNKFKSYEGVIASWNPNSATKPVRFFERKPTSSDSQLMNTTGSDFYRQLGDDQTPGAVFQLNTPYRLTYTVEGTSASELKFTLGATGGSLSGFSFSTSTKDSSAYFTSVFDSFALYSLSSSGIGFSIDNLLITHTGAAVAAASNNEPLVGGLGFGATNVPEPSTYAACAGAAVLGLAFWRRRRAAAKAAVA